MKRIVFLALGLAVALGARAESAEIQILDPWVQAAPPNVKVLAAYLEIRNNGEKPQLLVNISSPAFGLVEIHRSVMHGNMTHMEHQKELAIPPHASVTMRPGGMHLMLMKANKPLRTGDAVPMTLTFKNGEKAEVAATVRSGLAEDAGGHQHDSHAGHKNH